MTTLEELGPRICILGPSNSGKSTLANAIERRLGLPAVHLDQFFHQPGTNWVPRPESEFIDLHQAAIAQDRWVMDGNYSRHLPPRLQRATGLIVLDVSTATSLLRYFRRTLFERQRHGALEGGQDSIKWQMIRHITIVTPPNRRKYLSIFEQSSLPKIRLYSARALTRFYKREGLDK